MNLDPAFIKQEILAIVFRSFRKITPSNLEKMIREKFDLKRQVAKQVIKELVSGEDLAYTNVFGCTFLERSFGHPVKIGSKIILCPPDRCPAAEPGEVIVKIMGGASFGSGDHPTTRLCLQGLESVMEDPEHAETLQGGHCLDIGTGSGVLLIAAMKLGMGQGLGLDLDPNALSEARQNTTLNDLDSRVKIGNLPLESLTRSYPLILANLRFPTLAALASDLSRLCENNGFLVFSGFRPDEFSELAKAYESRNFENIWLAEENNWGASVFKQRNH
jgi:ribosomal protein L11 methyltransferase